MQIICSQWFLDISTAAIRGPSTVHPSPEINPIPSYVFDSLQTKQLDQLICRHKSIVGTSTYKVEIDWKHIACVDFLADQFSWPLWHTVGVFSRFFHVQGAFTMFQLKEINRGIPTYGYLWNFHTVKDTLIWGFVSSPLWSQPRQEQCFSENNSQRLTLMSGGK